MHLENIHTPLSYIFALLLSTVALETHHSSISAGSLRTVDTISAPYFGGLVYIALAISFNCDFIFMASCDLPFPSTTVRQPTLSPASNMSFVDQILTISSVHSNQFEIICNLFFYVPF